MKSQDKKLLLLWKQAQIMITNGTVVSDALKYVNGKAEKLKLEVESGSESKESEEPDYGEEEDSEEGQEKDTGELEEEKTADEDIDMEETHDDIF